jgi:2-polyprenyl-3-methyl-5-hydroxy-6-metoxy-1,4-benzoquinol methylase
MNSAEAMKPIGLAIKDFYAGDLSAEVKIVRDDGLVNSMSINVFFRNAMDFQLDKLMLDHCRGRVLDVGAGAGIHSLYLQEKGFSVCAMDISPEACEVMRARGVKEVQCISFADLKTGSYDTLLVLGRSICMVETLAGLDDFLLDARKLVKSGGQILLNSLDVRKTYDRQNLAYQEANIRAGRYIGEMRLYREYKGIVGPMSGLLHVDAGTLATHAAGAGWSFENLLQEKDGNYAARLAKKS